MGIEKWLWMGVLALGVISAEAARPLRTDDAGVIEPAGCEIEAAHTRERVEGDTARTEEAALNCGVGLRSQLGLGYGERREGQARARSAALLGKTTLWAGDGDDAPAVALGWALGRSRAPGESWRRDSSGVRLIGTLPLGPVFVHANLGHLRLHPDHTNSSAWGLAVESRELSLGPTAWAPMAEAFGDDHGDRWLAAALRWTLRPGQLYLDLSHARQQQGVRARVTQAGLRFAF